MNHQSLISKNVTEYFVNGLEKMQQSKFNFLSSAFKNLLALVSVIVMTIMGTSVAGAVEYVGDENVPEVFLNMLNDNGDGWLCYWRVDMPDRVPFEDKAKKAPGLTGYSEVNFTVKDNKPGLTIPVFIFDYSLDFVLDMSFTNIKNLEVRDIKFNELRGTEGYTAYRGLILKAVSYTKLDANYYEFKNSDVFKKLERPENISVSRLDVDDANTFSLNFAGPFFLITKWDGQPNNSVYDFSFNIKYASDITLTFFKRTDSIDYASYIVKGEEKETTYPVVVTQGDGFIDIDNLYRMGKGFAGDVYQYNHRDYILEETTTRIFLNSDGSATFEKVNPGMLNILPLPMEKIGSQADSRRFATRNYINYFTDYVVLSDEQFRKVNYLEGTTNLDEYENAQFYDDFVGGKLEAPQGFWTRTSTTNVKNHFWDRDGARKIVGSVEVIFPAHHLLQLRYQYYDITTSIYHGDYFCADYASTKSFDKLSLSVPEYASEEESATIDLKINAAGNSVIDDIDQRKYIYLEGNLSSSADDVELFIVRGYNSNYLSDLLDPEIGHKYGLLATQPQYVYPQPGNNALTAMSSANEISLLIPETDVPAVEGAETDVYTIYAKYNEADGTPRFRNLTTLTKDEMTTNVRSVADSPADAFRVDGKALTALKDNLTVYNTLGQLVTTVTSGDTAVLPTGSYIVKTANASTPARKIVVLP